MQCELSDLKGTKVVTDEDGFWDDFDEAIGGALETLVDESDYEEGFVWSCCEKPISEGGCKKGKHISVKQRWVYMTSNSSEDDSGK